MDELVQRYEEEREERELKEKISHLVSKLRLNRGEKQPADKRRKVDSDSSENGVVEINNESDKNAISITCGRNSPFSGANSPRIPFYMKNKKLSGNNPPVNQPYIF